MQRRQWLMIAVVLLVVTACGGEGTSETAACEAGVTDGDLRFYNWSEYIDEDLIASFEEEYGVAVTYDFYDSNETLLAQIQAGAVWDLIVPSDYMVGIMIQEDLLLGLDKEALPNLANLDPGFTGLSFDPADAYSVPYQYGTTGIAVNKALVGEDFPRSWSLLFDPEVSAAFPGGVSVLNDAREAMGAALKYLGYSLNESSDEALEAASGAISDARVNITVFDSDTPGDNLVNGEVAVAHGWSGTMISAFSEADDPDQFEYFIPEEGGVLFVDTMAIPAAAIAPCTAHAMIDWLLEAENGAQLTNYLWYGSPNLASLPFIDEDVVEFYANVGDADLEVIEDTGADEIRFTDYFAQARG